MIRFQQYKDLAYRLCDFSDMIMLFKHLKKIPVPFFFSFLYFMDVVACLQHQLLNCWPFKLQKLLLTDIYQLELLVQTVQKASFTASMTMSQPKIMIRALILSLFLTPCVALVLLFWFFLGFQIFQFIPGMFVAENLFTLIKG